MHPHNGMSRDNRRPPHMFAISHGTFSLWEARMLSSQSFQQFLDRFRKALVGCNLGYPPSISTCRGNLQEREDGDGWRLVLVGHIGVVSCCCETSGSTLCAIEVVGSEVDVVEFNVILDVSSYRLSSLNDQLSAIFLPCGMLTWTCNFPKYSPNSFCFCGPMSLKSWPRNTTTPLSAMRRARSFFWASVS